MAKDKGVKYIEKKIKHLEILEVEYVDPGSIKPNTYNPNRQSEHEFELLLRSMREDGFTQPIICMRDTREIVDGEHRWKAGNTLGFKKVPVVFVDMTPEQMRIATLRHNRARGTEDIELSAQVLRDLRELGALDWAQDSLMLSDVDMQRLLEDVKAPDALAAAAFSPAWQPGQLSDVERVDGEVVSGGETQTSMTPAAAEAVQDARKKLEAAKTEEEKKQIEKESQIYRLSVIYAGEEAKIVKAVLGANPAATMLAMCRSALESRAA